MKINDIIINRNNPEWGTWKILEDHDYGFVIRGNSGERVLDHWEAKRFWELAK